MVQLQKADKAFGAVIEKSSTTQDAHIYRARVNGLLSDATAKAQMAKSYEDYVNVVVTKGGNLVTENKAKFIEAYQELTRYYGKTDKVKATDFITKALALDPADVDTINLKNSLK